MRRLPPHRALICASLGAILLGLLLPAVGGAGSSAPELRSRAGSLRSENSTLSAQSRSALVQLYALESRLSAARQRLAELQARAASVREEQSSTRHQLAVVRHVLSVSQRHLRERLIALYETEEPDALAAFLNAGSLREATTRLDGLTSVATQDRSVIHQTRGARASLQRLTRALQARAERLSRLEASATQAAGALESARAEKAGFISSLAAQRRANDAQISSLEAQAREAESRSDAVSAQQAVAPVAAPSVPSSGPVSSNTLTVVATAYALGGTTATGIPVGPGVVAVDPGVIPLGTRMTIPGYGEGVAADTGGAIIGNRIDVWVPTEAEAEQWGVRTVTITLH